MQLRQQAAEGSALQFQLESAHQEAAQSQSTAQQLHGQLDLMSTQHQQVTHHLLQALQSCILWLDTSCGHHVHSPAWHVITGGWTVSIEE